MTDVFLHLTNMSITASFLIGVVLVLRLVLKKVPKNLLLWLWALVGLRLALPASLESALSLIPNPQPIPPNIAMSPAPAVAVGIPVIDNAVNPVIASSFTPAPAASANPLQIILPIFSVLWLLGVAAMLLYALISYLRLSRHVSASIPLGKDLYVCDGIPTPFLLGIRKPKIYLPSEMSPEYRAYVLKHEYAHLRHHDNWWKSLGYLLLSVYWFNPLLWVAYVLFCRDLEIACDERAVANMTEPERKAYSYALLACAAPRHVISVCPVAFGENSVKSRIRNVLRFKKATVWVSALVFLIAAVTAICFLTNPKEETEESEAPTQAQAETLPQETATPTQSLEENILTLNRVDAAPYPELAGLPFEDLDGDYTYVNGDLTLLFHNVKKVATHTLEEKYGTECEQTILLKTPDTTMEVINADVGRQSSGPWMLSEYTSREDDIPITDQTGKVSLPCNEYWLRPLGTTVPFLRLISRIEPCPGELLEGSPSPYPPSQEDLTFSPEEVVFQDLDGEYTYENGNLSLLFSKVSKVGTRTLRDRNGEEYTQTILMKDFGTTMELSSADMDGSQWAWRVSELNDTGESITVTDQMPRRIFSNNEYYMQDLLTGRTVLLLKRAARLSEVNGELQPKTAQTALAVDQSSGEVLYSYQSTRKIPTGIQNKLTLALTVLEEHSPEELVDVTDLPGYLLQEPCYYLHNPLPPLEDMREMTVEDLLTLSLLWNDLHDVSFVLARFDAGSEDAMVEKMNALVGQLCQDTHFTDIYGIAKDQYTTGQDTLLLVNRALENPCLRRIWTKTQLTLSPSEGEERTVYTANYMRSMQTIPEFFDLRVTGGFSRSYNLVDDMVCTAKDGDRQIICVLLGAQREVDENKPWLCKYYANFEETAALLNTVLG